MHIILNDQHIDEIWGQVLNIMNGHPDPILGIDSTYQFEFTDIPDRPYQLIFKSGSADVITDTLYQSECIITMSVEDFKKLLIGNLNSTTAYMQGKIKVKGSLGLALRLETVLKKYRLSLT